MDRSIGEGDLFDLRRVPVTPIRSRDANLPFSDYVEYAGPPGHDPRNVNARVVSEGIVRIIEVEGPVVAKRVYDIYLRGCGIKRMGHELKSTMNKALSHAIRQGRVVCEDEAGKGGLLFSVVRVNGSPPVRLRSRGPRSFEEIPPSELQVVARYLAERHGFSSGSDEHLRAVLECFDLTRLTTQVGTTLLEILERRFPYVDEFLEWHGQIACVAQFRMVLTAGKVLSVGGVTGGSVYHQIVWPPHPPAPQPLTVAAMPPSTRRRGLRCQSRRDPRSDPRH